VPWGCQAGFRSLALICETIKITGFLFCFLVVSSSAAALGAELSGQVVATMNSGRYTYLQLEKNGGRQWVAVPAILLRVGDEVDVRPGITMRAFSSPTLRLTFEEIIFSPGVKTIAARVAGADAGTPGSPAAAATLEKATGDAIYTIEELFARKSDLDGQEVVVIGKVVKISQHNGKLWIRIIDGTGSRKRGNHKLIVTSEQGAENGDIITVKGIVRADKSIGSFTYDVVVEDAAIEKKTI
jgi:hypothetical protein